MLKKEFKDVLKQTLILIISVFALIYPIYLIASIFTKHIFVFSEYFQMFYQLFIFFFSFFLGISMFSKEGRNNGFEYLLTLPYSRTKLLIQKITPRFIMLVILYLGYLLMLALRSTDPFLFAPVSFISLYFSLFFISTSLSVLRGNFVGNSIITFLLFLLFLFSTNFVAWLVTIKYFGRAESFKLRTFVGFETFPFSSFSIFLLALLISIPFMVSLFYGFKKYDIRSSGRYLKRFFFLLVPLVLAGMAISYVVLNASTGKFEARHYITKKGIILRHDYSGTYNLSETEADKLPEFYPYQRNFYERENFVYVSVWHWENDPKGCILKFNDTFKSHQKIYLPPDNRFLHRYLYGYKKTLAILESSGKKYSWNKSSENHLVFFNTATGDVKKFKFPYEYLKLAGVSDINGDRYWIGYHVENMGVTVYTINDEGDIKKILRSSRDPLFISGQLITVDHDQIVLGRFINTGYEEVARIAIKGKPIFPYYYNTSDLNGWEMKYLYAKLFNKVNVDPDQKRPPIEFLCIDLVNYSIKRFSDDRVVKGIIYPVLPEETFFLSFKGYGNLQFDGIYQMRGLELKLVRDFKSGDVVLRENWGLAGNGFVVGKGNEVRFFLFPDLKELK